MNGHGYDEKRFPLATAQGRALYHLERLFRSTGAGIREHAKLLQTCAGAGLDVARVQDWTVAQCVLAMQYMEEAARPMALFRDVRTGWQDFDRGGRFCTCHRCTRV